mgnify:CR=1 FL=1
MGRSWVGLGRSWGRSADRLKVRVAVGLGSDRYAIFSRVRVGVIGDCMRDPIEQRAGHQQRDLLPGRLPSTKQCSIDVKEEDWGLSGVVSMAGR